MLARGRLFLSHVVPAVAKPLRVIWNQSIGLLFLLFVIASAPRAYSEVRDLQNGGGSVVRLLLTAVFVLAMAAFAAQSFWRARKASR